MEVDEICKIIRPFEEQCYLKETFNKKIIS